MSQIQEMIKPAAAMLDTYPVVTTKQKIKQWIKTCVPGMTPEKAERYSWPQALLAMGLLQAYEQTKDKTALSSVFSYLRRWKNSAGRTLRPVGISGSDWIEFSQQAVRRRTLRGFPRT